MINVAKQIESARPSRSLLMSYCASLPFFERDVLPNLQQVGEGHVTVLVDEAQYQASFSDLVRGAGVCYRVPSSSPTAQVCELSSQVVSAAQWTQS